MSAEELDWEAYFERERAYFRDPTIEWFDEGALSVVGLSEPGYYVLGSCGEPGCCTPVGPFSTADEALAHSRDTLVAFVSEREAKQTESGRS